jgi:hypothetical protein
MNHPDPMMNLAEAVAAVTADTGMAFIEDDKIGALRETLAEFLARERIPLDLEDGIAYYDQKARGCGR